MAPHSDFDESKSLDVLLKRLAVARKDAQRAREQARETREIRRRIGASMASKSWK